MSLTGKDYKIGAPAVRRAPYKAPSLEKSLDLPLKEVSKFIQEHARIGVQFERAAPVVIPFRVEVDDQIQPAMLLRLWMTIEVDVRVELLAVAVVVGTAAEVPGVVAQVGDAGGGAQPVEKGL